MRTVTYLLSLLLIFVIPIEGLLRFPGVGTLAKLIGLFVGVCWLVTVVVTRRLRKPGLMQILLILFVAWNGMSVLWSANPQRTANHFMTWLQLLGLSLMLWDIYTSRPYILGGLQAYVLGAYVAVGSALTNYLSGRAFYTNYERFASGNSNPDGFGFILALGLPIAWFLAATQNVERGRALWKFINYAYIPVAFVGLALSGTRTALLASIVGMLFGLVMLTRVRLWLRIAIFAVLVVSVLYLVPQLQSLKSFQRLGTTGTELTQGDLNNRTNNWQEGFASFERRPLLGVGGNMYRSVNTWDKVAHNSYLSILVELGMVGLLIFAGILAVALMAALSQKRARERIFWLTLLAVWGMGASTLTWEYRKTTWLFLTLIVANAAVTQYQEARARRLSAVESALLPVQENASGD